MARPGPKRKNIQAANKGGSKKPAQPAWLCPIGKSEWKRVCNRLYDMGLLDEIDTSLLAIYCDSYARMRRATKELHKGGLTTIAQSGYECQRPQVAIINKAVSEMRAACKMLGIGADSRGRMSVKQESPAKDPMDKFD